jgi:putative transcriptional regulator
MAAKTPGQKIIEGAEEALRFVRGEDTGAIVWQIEVPNALEVRTKLGLSQEAFARKFRISLGTLRNWEQGARSPEGPARVLLSIIDKEPEAVERALQAAKPKRVDASVVRPKAVAKKRAAAAAVKAPKRSIRRRT